MLYPSYNANLSTYPEYCILARDFSFALSIFAGKSRFDITEKKQLWIISPRYPALNAQTY